MNKANTFPRPRGGVVAVELIPALSWAGAVPAADTTQWHFREDHASYSEEMTGPSLAPLVPAIRQTLTMDLPATAEFRAAAASLVSTSARQGLVAVVTMASGEVIVAGWSASAGVGWPLRVTKQSSDSGLSPANFPTISLTLETTLI